VTRPYSLVSVIIPALNEEGYIANCINSLLASDFPLEKLEILVVDGGSVDRTVAIVNQLSRSCQQLRVLHNPKKFVSSAMNIGASQATGEILVRIDAHAIYHTDYIKLSVTLLAETGAAGVGGVISPRGEGVVGEAIAATVSLPIGTGGAAWRSGKSPGWVDTIWCGCFWKEDFVAVGGFNEEWEVNQDAEFNARLKTKIGGLYFDPRIRATYFVRNSLRALIRQYYRYGMWRAKTLRKHPDRLRIRQVVPVFFVASFIGCLALLNSVPWLFPGFMFVYLLSMVIPAFSIKPVRSSAMLVPFIAFCIHFSWGTGFIANLLSVPFSSTRTNSVTSI
jgi:glycosyltransferase involved in cell wall biosynthesis